MVFFIGVAVFQIAAMALFAVFHLRPSLTKMYEEHLEKYISDPLCSFVFTVNAYYSMFTGMLIMEKKESIYMIPKQLPILFAAGAEDPVGGFGKGVRKVYEKYKAAGIQDISLRLYAGDRHELLNETDREQVYEDLLEWMEERRKINY